MGPMDFTALPSAVQGPTERLGNTITAGSRSSAIRHKTSRTGRPPPYYIHVLTTPSGFLRRTEERVCPVNGQGGRDTSPSK